VIGLGIRLAVSGGREAIVRLVVIAAAVALGVGLLLATVAGINGVKTQNARYAWLNSAIAAPAGPSTVDPVWWRLRGDYFDGRTIGRVEVATTGPNSPVPPGIPRLPGPGEYYASPEMAKLMTDTPANELADRFPGHQIGTIGSAALPAPNSLIIVIGYTPAQMSTMDGAKQVTAIATVPPSSCSDCAVGVHASGMDLILGVVAGAFLFPVLIFIGAATRLSAARREQRFAAMRLVGASPRQVSVLSAVESTVAAVAGTAIGFGLFFALRDPLAAIPFTGAPFFPSDLSLNVLDILLVALGVPAGSALAALLALRRVRISPLGVTRRVTPKPPRAYRLIVLVLGLGELAYFLVNRPPDTGVKQVAVFLPGFLVVMTGLIVAGPWFTMVGARLLARRASRPASLVAARRLADNPQASFRAISGLVLALFVTTVSVGVISTMAAHRGVQADGTASHTAMSVEFWETDHPPMSVPDKVVDDIAAVPGVRAVLVVRHNPDDQQMGTEPGLVACADLAKAPEYGVCPSGTAVAQVYPDFVGPARAPMKGWLAAPYSVEQLQQFPVLAVTAATDGSTAALERARTVLEAAYPDARAPATEDDFATDSTNLFNQYQQLANVVILATLPIAGCSLAVSVAGALSERKRPFALLRLSGVPLRMLRRVVALEGAVPLLAVAAVAMGMGFLSAQLFLRAQLHYTLAAPSLEYYLIVAAGLLASLGIIGSTLPLLERITGPETARNE
jgi:hypothetical protein